MFRYFRYEIKNIEPLRIANDAGSQSGQTVTLRYILGTTIRGFIINSAAREKDFEEKKKVLFSDKVRYLNAYMMENGEELIPSPKGFYEDKTVVEGKKKLQNVVVHGEFSNGYKRAAIGRYCYMDSDCIYYYNVKTGSDMKIKINLSETEKQNIFRNEYMTAGNTFVGYIAIDVDESSIESIESTFLNIIRGTIVLGNGRTAGLGKCVVKSAKFVDSIPYSKYMPTQDQTQKAYMMLMSPTTMRNKRGEYCGLDIKQLEKKLGVTNLEIPFCSTSIVEVKGYNRTWRTKIPSITMYEQGSVFRLSFDGIMKKERISQICHEGIGVRKNEGFGRILFLNDYENIHYKLEEEKSCCLEQDTPKYPEDEKILNFIAANYYKKCIDNAIRKYVLENPIDKGEVSNSQLGNILSLALAYQYDIENGKKNILDYFVHAKEKEEKNKTQKTRNSIKNFQKTIEYILDEKNSMESILDMESQKEKVMGVPRQRLLSPKDYDYFKMKLIVELIRYDNRKEAI